MSATLTRFPARQMGALAAVAALTCATLLLAVSARGVSDVSAGPASSGAGSLSALPAAARGSVSEALGRAQPSYRVVGWRAQNAAQGLRLSFGRGRVTVATGKGRVAFSVSGFGRPGAIRTVAAASPRADANMVRYAHARFVEWYANGPLGLDQGFSVSSPPRGRRGGLVIGLRLAGIVRAHADQGGVRLSGVGIDLHYGGLRATDAHGRRLRSWLSVRGPSLQIIVDDRAAAYPLRIDPFIQRGAKLIGTDAVGNAQQGYSVALSRDGGTAVVGGPVDNGAVGAAWVFTRVGDSWTQQTLKLVGTGAVGNAEQGFSVALSSDGNTALIGGPGDNGGAGAAWVFTRTGANWTQQGLKLVGAGASGAANQGNGVALSSDGNTALIGGPGDNGAAGAAWIFTRTGANWTQQGAKIVGSGAVGNAQQGYKVALSADGNTAVIGGRADDGAAGAAWVFTRSAGAWAQQGTKLVGTGAIGKAVQGDSVAVSSDGNTILVGGPADDSLTGAAWVFARTGGDWTQQGPKLVAADADAKPEEGTGVALSGDGNSAIVGGSNGNGTGGAWLYARSGAAWTQQGAKLVGADATPNSEQGSSVALSGDAITALIGGVGDNGNVGAAWIFGMPSIGGPSRLTFGSQPVQQPGPVLWLPVVNSGQAPLTITGAATIAGPDAGDFAIPAGDELCNGATLQPRQLCWIGVQFTPARAGLHNATLALGASNAALSPTITLTGTGLAASSGLTGPPGPPGSTGPRGPSGQIELVTCHAVTTTVNRNGKKIKVTRQRCTATLTNAPVTFTTTGWISASLKRGRTLYGLGIARRTGHGTQLLLTARRRLTPGRYTLHLAQQHRTTVIVR